MALQIRTANLQDVSFLADVVIQATLAQGRFPSDTDLTEYRSGYEDWTQETVVGGIPDCTLSVIELDGIRIGRLRVLRNDTAITLAGIQLMPDYQNNRIGTTLVDQLKQEADLKAIPLHVSVEKDNPRALRLYQRLGCAVLSEDAEGCHLEYRREVD